MVITEPPEPSARLLSLGSKLYPSNMKRMLNKDLIRFKQILSRVRQNRASERKVLLAGLVYMKCTHRGSEVLLLEKMQLAKYSCFIWKGTCISYFTKSRENGYKLLVQWILGSFGLTSVSYDMVDGIEGNYWPIISDACLLPEIVFSKACTPMHSIPLIVSGVENWPVYELPLLPLRNHQHSP